jgi:hypothetical protein
MTFAGFGALSVLVVFSSNLAPALGYCEADDDCTNCTGWGRCTGCKPGYYLQDWDGDGEGLCYQDWDSGSDDYSYDYSCEWKDEYAEDWYGKILVGSIIGFVITLGTTITLSLPVCCGVMKKANVKVIGIICGIIGGLSLFIPFISGAVSSGALVEDICDACTHGCSDTDRDELNTHLGALGVIVAYIHGMGFLVVVMGAITLCLSCCTCCPCCGPLKADNNVTPVNPNAPQGQVVGQPVDQAAKAW